MNKPRWYHRFMPDYEVLVRLEAQDAKLDLILKGVKAMDVDLSKLQADVDAQTTVIAGATTLLSGLAAEIADLKNAGSASPAVQAAIDALALKVEQNSGTLAASVQANTPVADTPPPTPAPTTSIPDGTPPPAAS